MKKIFLVLLYLSSSSLLTHLEREKHEISLQGIFSNLLDAVKNVLRKKEPVKFDKKWNLNLTFDNLIGYEKEIESISKMFPILKNKNTIKSPIILTGSQYSGKKTFVYTVANMLKSPTVTINCQEIRIKSKLSFMNEKADIVLLESTILEAIQLAKKNNGMIVIDKLEVFSEKYFNSIVFVELIQFLVNVIKKNNTVQFFFLFSLDYMRRQFENIIIDNFNGEQFVTLLRGIILFSDTINTESKKKKFITVILKKYGIRLEEESLFNDIYSLLAGDGGGENINQKMKYFIYQLQTILKNEGASVVTQDIFNQLKDRVIPVFNKAFNRQIANSDEIVENFSLDDVMGYDQIKKILKKMIPHMRNASLKQKGILLYGPPGTGKTQFVKALAGSAGISLITLNPASILNKETTIGSVFEMAEYKKPSILFIDEIDVLLVNRDYLSSLLIYLDGIKTFYGVTVIGVTNFPATIDDRVSRPGRLSTMIEVSYPNKKDREEIIAHYIKKNDINFENEALLAKILTMTAHKTGAEIKNFIESIQEYKEEHQQEIITEEILYSLFLEAMIGKEKQYDIPHEELIQVAYHEAAHGFIQYMLHKENKSLFDFDVLTIEPRENALGMSISQKTDVYNSFSKRKLEGELQILLAGKASQELFCNQVDSGASNDLLRATNLAYEYVTLYGMGRRLASKRPIFSVFEQELSKDIQEEVERVLQNNFSQVKSLLMRYKNTITIMVEELLVKKRLYKKDIERILQNEYKENNK